MLYAIGKALSAAVCRIFGRWKVLGRENVPTTGGALLCANHVSYIDPPALGGGCPRPVRFMAKSELFKLPVLGFLIRRVGAFPVKRGTADRTALRKAVELLESGEIVGMFPEGTRSLDGKLQEPELGVGMIASWGASKAIEASGAADWAREGLGDVLEDNKEGMLEEGWSTISSWLD